METAHLLSRLASHRWVRPCVCYAALATRSVCLRDYSCQTAAHPAHRPATRLCQPASSCWGCCCRCNWWCGVRCQPPSATLTRPASLQPTAGCAPTAGSAACCWSPPGSELHATSEPAVRCAYRPAMSRVAFMICVAVQSGSAAEGRPSKGWRAEHPELAGRRPRWRQIAQIKAALPARPRNTEPRSTRHLSITQATQMRTRRAAGARHPGSRALSDLPDHLLELCLPCKRDDAW